MIGLFHDVSRRCSQITTKKYSTSFSSAIRLLHKDFRQPIYSIYGFVRFADEIVDTFHGHDQIALLTEFKRETFLAVERGISLNPILNSFQKVVHQFNIGQDLIDSFFKSMECDLHRKQHDRNSFDEYVYGSAEVVGLMCLQVFCESDKKLYTNLQAYARSLGAAFQKVNFLRDVRSDVEQLNRCYFPDVDFSDFTVSVKQDIEDEIHRDFVNAYKGITLLPVKARFGVYVAYKYYLSLFRKIKRVKPARIFEQRVRVPNYSKAMIVVRAGVKSQFNLI